MGTPTVPAGPTDGDDGVAGEPRDEGADGVDGQDFKFASDEAVVTTTGALMEALEATDIRYGKIDDDTDLTLFADLTLADNKQLDISGDTVVLTDMGIDSVAADDLSLRGTVQGTNIEIGVRTAVALDGASLAESFTLTKGTLAGADNFANALKITDTRVEYHPAGDTYIQTAVLQGTIDMDTSGTGDIEAFLDRFPSRGDVVLWRRRWRSVPRTQALTAIVRAGGDCPAPGRAGRGHAGDGVA